MGKQQIPPLETVQTVIRRVKRAGGAEMKDLRKEYSNLRKIANKRIARAQANNELLEQELFPETRNLLKGADDNPIALVKSYVQVVKFLRSKRSTAKGRAQLREKRVTRLQELGFTNVDVNSEKFFDEFMRYWRMKYEIITPYGKRLIIDSDFAVEAFDMIRERTKDEDMNASKFIRLFDKFLKSKGLT